MPYPVTLEPGGHTFVNAPGESILQSALNNGLSVRYGCSNGNCGECIAELIDGEVNQLQHSDYPLSSIRSGSKHILMCTNRATTAVTLKAVATDAVESIEPKDFSVKLKKIQTLENGVMAIEVQTPRTKRLRFFAGQSARLNCANFTIELPIASCPCEDRDIVFHLPAGNESFISELQALRRNTPLTLNAPYGEFILDSNSTSPRVMIGTGVGLAPLRSIIEHSIALHPDTAINILMISNNEQPPYLHNLMRSWSDAFENVVYNWSGPKDALLAIQEKLESPNTQYCKTIDLYLACNPLLKNSVNLSLKKNESVHFAVHYLNTENYSSPGGCG